MKKLNLKTKITSMYLAKTAVLSVLSFVLYAFAKFPLPFMFPSFLDMQFSELPALLAGFAMGPLSGCIVIVIRCLLKMTMTTTGFVGELTDLVLGLSFVLPASLIYKYRKSKKSAIVALGVGTVCSIVVSVVLNRFVSIPFYVSVFFDGNWNILLNMVRPLYPNITKQTFYTYYLLAAVVPFNILRSGITALLTFLLYKKLSRILHWEMPKSRPAQTEGENQLPTGKD